jgi:diguanylate cyclase (GGDEF)-like protein/PAS domain S-box-containing protein
MQDAIKDAHKPKEQLVAELEALRRQLADFQTTEARDAWARVEAALRETEERYRELFENASDLIYTHDLTGRFTSVNKAAELVTGYTAGELLQMNLSQIVAPEHLDLVRSMAHRELPGDERPRDEIEIVAKDGRRVALEVGTRVVREDGVPAGVQGIARDVTERRRATEALRKQHQQQQIILDSVPAMVIYVDPSSRIVRVNRAAAELLGRSVPELQGCPLAGLQPEELAAFLGRDVDEILAGEPKHAATAEVPVPAGGRRWIQKDAVPYRDDSGRVSGAIVFAVDVTERRRAEQASRENEEQFRALFELAPVGIARLDVQGRFIDCNRALIQMLGYQIGELEGRPIAELTHPDDAAEAAAALQELVEGRREASHAERRYFRRDGAPIWTDVTASVVRDAAGHAQFVIATIENISERKEAEEALRLTNQRLTGWVTELEQRNREIDLLREMGEMLQACKGADEAYGVIERMARQLFASGSGSVCVMANGTSMLETVAAWGEPESERLFSGDECWALRRGRPHVVQDPQLGLICRHMSRPLGEGYLCVPMMAQNETIGLLNLTLPEAGRPSEARQRLAATVAEHVSLSLANLRLQERLRGQSIRDPLTGLFNRRYMEESLEREMRRAGRGRHPVGILMLDIDHFKGFNDTYGHEAGDALLREVGAILQRSIRGEDIACRFGGEEFALIMPEASLLDSAQRAEQLREAIRGLNIHHRRQPLGQVTISVGVAIYPDHGPTGDAVLRAADAALYQAKARGRDRVAINAGGLGSAGFDGGS